MTLDVNERDEMDIGSPADLTRSRAAAMRDRDARGRRTMEALHAALLALIEEQPFERITIDAIVERAGVGRSTFYRHYATKDDLIEEIARAEIEALVDLCMPPLDLDDSLPSCLETARFVHGHRKLWGVLLTGGASAVMRQRFVELAQARGHAMQRPGAVIPIELGAVWGVAATFEILAWWLRQPDPISVEHAAHYLNHLSVRPSLELPAYGG